MTKMAVGSCDEVRLAQVGAGGSGHHAVVRVYEVVLRLSLEVVRRPAEELVATGRHV